MTFCSHTKWAFGKSKNYHWRTDIWDPTPECWFFQLFSFSSNLPDFWKRIPLKMMIVFRDIFLVFEFSLSLREESLWGNISENPLLFLEMPFLEKDDHWDFAIFRKFMLERFHLSAEKVYFAADSKSCLWPPYIRILSIGDAISWIP